MGDQFKAEKIGSFSHIRTRTGRMSTVELAMSDRHVSEDAPLRRSVGEITDINL